MSDINLSELSKVEANAYIVKKYNLSTPVDFLIHDEEGKIELVKGFKVGVTSIAYARRPTFIKGEYLYRWMIFNVETGNKVYSGRFKRVYEAKEWIVQNFIEKR